MTVLCNRIAAAAALFGLVGVFGVVSLEAEAGRQTGARPAQGAGEYSRSLGVELSGRSDGRFDGSLRFDSGETRLMYAGRRTPGGELTQGVGISTPEVVVGPLQLRGPVARLSSPLDPPGSVSSGRPTRHASSLRDTASSRSMTGAVVRTRPQWFGLRGRERTSLATVLELPADPSAGGVAGVAALTRPNGEEAVETWFPQERTASDELLAHLGLNAWLSRDEGRFFRGRRERGARRDLRLLAQASAAPALRPGLAVYLAYRGSVDVSAGARAGVEPGTPRTGGSGRGSGGSGPQAGTRGLISAAEREPSERGADFGELVWWNEVGVAGANYTTPEGKGLVPRGAGGAPLIGAYRLQGGAEWSRRRVWRVRGEVEGFVAGRAERRAARRRPPAPERGVLWRRRAVQATARHAWTTRAGDALTGRVESGLRQDAGDPARIFAALRFRRRASPRTSPRAGAARANAAGGAPESSRAAGAVHGAGHAAPRTSPSALSAAPRKTAGGARPNAAGAAPDSTRAASAPKAGAAPRKTAGGARVNAAGRRESPAAGGSSGSSPAATEVNAAGGAPESRRAATAPIPAGHARPVGATGPGRPTHTQQLSLRMELQGRDMELSSGLRVEVPMACDQEDCTFLELALRTGAGFDQGEGWAVSDLELNAAVARGAAELQLGLESRGRPESLRRTGFFEAYRLRVALSWEGRVSPTAAEQRSRGNSGAGTR